jgi:ribose transport system ATP-binding protein
MLSESYLLQMQDIHKRFPGVYALKGANLEVRHGEILGLVGENGAGKSTMMKILLGLYKQDKGKIFLRGQEVCFDNPKDAAMHGVGMVFQEQSLLSNMTIAENLFIPHEKRFKENGFIQWRKLEHEAERVLQRVNVYVSPRTRLGDLGMAHRQMVEIARLLWLSELSETVPLIILDEPTTVLSKQESDTLFELMKELKKNASIILISHRLDEIIGGTDRIVVFRDGSDVARFNSENTDIRDLHKVMVGRELATEYYRESEQREPQDEVLLSIRKLSLEGKFDDISFDLRRGEILSLVGTVGSGKESIVRCIAGVEKPSSGTIMFKGETFTPNAPGDGVSSGIGYVPENRRDEGLVLYFDVGANISLPKLELVTEKGFLSGNKERRLAHEWIDRLRIVTPSDKSLCVNLSGGNQQKVVLAKWLASNVELLLLDHPTRGIDVGAKEEVYTLIRELARENMSMILMADTLEEDIGLANRLIIFKDGRQVCELRSDSGDKPTPVDVIQYMV